MTTHVKPLERREPSAVLHRFVDLLTLFSSLSLHLYKNVQSARVAKAQLLEEHVKPLSCHPAKTQSQHRAHPLNDHHDGEHNQNDDNNDDDVEDV